MIDIKQELQKFSRIDLNNLSDSIGNIPDNIKNSIILYNKALDNINSKSEDIAIIELKKAISLNPDFYEAMNLLGICYSYIQDHQKAAEMFEKVMAAEKNSLEASRLMDSLKVHDVTQMGKDLRKKSKSGSKAGSYRPDDFIVRDPGSSPANSKDRQSSQTITKFGFLNKTDAPKYIAALILGALIVFLASLPVYLKNDSGTLTNEIKENKLRMEASAAEITALKQQIGDLNEKYTKLEEDKNKSDLMVDYYKNSIKLFDVESLFNAKKYEQAGDKLLLLKDAEFKDNEKKKYDELGNNVFNKAAWTVYSEGLSLSGARRYKEALAKLSKVQLYKNDLNYMDSVLYSMGVCYKNMDDSRSALGMFQKVVDMYPKSQYAQYSKTRINEITGRP